MEENLKGFHASVKIIKYAVVGCMVIWLFVGWKIFYPYNPLNYRSFYVSKDVVFPGDKVCFQIVGEKLISAQADVLVELVNGEAFEIMKYQANNPVGKLHIPRCFLIPKVLPGKYKIRWTGVWMVNSLNHPRQTHYSDFITILDEPAPQKGDKGDKGKQGKQGEPGGFSFFGNGKK